MKPKEIYPKYFFLKGIDEDNIHSVTLPINKPNLSYFVFEQMITNGLGYRKIPHKLGLPREYDTKEDLTAHLAMMNMAVGSKILDREGYLKGEVFQDLIAAENALCLNAQYFKKIAKGVSELFIAIEKKTGFSFREEINKKFRELKR